MTQMPFKNSPLFTPPLCCSSWRSTYYVSSTAQGLSTDQEVADSRFDHTMHSKEIILGINPLAA